MPKEEAPADAGAGNAGDSSSPKIPRHRASVQEIESYLLAKYGDAWTLQLIVVAGPKWIGKEPGKRALPKAWQKLPETRWQAGVSAREIAHEIGLHVANKKGNVGIAVPERVCVLDHDCQEAFEKALRDFPDAPAQASHHGGHTVHRLPPGVTLKNRTHLELDNGSELDIRAHGTQFVCEPSVHREGTPYRWLRPLPANVDDLPLLPDSVVAQLPKKQDGGSDTDTQTHNILENPFPAQSDDSVAEEEEEEIECVAESLSHCVRLPELSPEESAQVAAAIKATLPLKFGQRNKCTFLLASRLKCIERITCLAAGALLPIVKDWHRLGLAKMRTKDFAETWLDFQTAWSKAQPFGAVWESCVQRAKDAPDPLAARIISVLCGGEPCPKFHTFVALAFELDRHHGGKQFPFPCRKAGKATGMSHDTANTRIQLMVSQQVLVMAKEAGGPPNAREAAEYRLNRNWPKPPPPDWTEASDH